MNERVHPLPQPLWNITLASLGVSVPILVLSFIDLGTVSFFLNLTASALTILHDATLIRMARRAAPTITPDYFDPAASGFNICMLLACAGMYAIGFGMTVFTAFFAERGDISWSTGTGMGTIVAQAVLAPVAAALLLLAAVYSFRMRRFGSPHTYGQF
ncbi:hypothetical protein BC834DRAFT_861852 [Gloeopeniophorella convolvens]|nr:hypothetical protein BC834DRAFT_861852 [Gloeopeniophorella convolvens]